MKNLLRLSAASLIAGAFALSACDSCPPPSTDTTGAGATQTSYTCGQGTKRVGNQCVNDNSGSSRNTTGTSTRGTNTLNTNGNN
jgi:hypothetical protein